MAKDRIISSPKGMPPIHVDAYPDKPLYKEPVKEMYNKSAPLAKTSREQAKP